jgi:chloramphenicol O-acetyltransferase type A
MKEIDVGKWNRKAHYECFSAYSDPIFSMSVRLDVTKLVEYTKKTDTSYFVNFLFIASKCLNEIEGFRLRITEDNRVVEYDVCRPSYIVMNKENVIVTCRSEMYQEYAKFYQATKADVERAKEETDRKTFNVKDEYDVFYTTCLPWVDLTSLKNPYDLKNPAQSSIPRLAWGKFVEKDGKYEMMMDIAAHHALLDGYPMAQAFVNIQKALDNVEEFLRG